MTNTAVTLATLKRLCDELETAVTPEGGYESWHFGAEYEGEAYQIVDAERWAPKFGCDSLDITLDSIKNRLLAVIRKLAIEELQITYQVESK